jgi:phospholipase/carboxylesterase
MTGGGLHHIARPPADPGPGLYPAVVFLHGRGADEHDLLGLADFFDPRYCFLSVRAPFAYPWGGHTWYEVGPDGSPDPDMFRTAVDGLAAFLREVPARTGADPARLVLFGFSMGAAMAHVLLHREPALIAGIVAASGYVPESVLPPTNPAALAGKPVLITHGTADPVLPVGMGRRSREIYERLPVRLTYTEFPGGHELPDTVITAASAFLADLPSTTRTPDHA